MKLFSLLVITFVGLGLFLPPTASAESEKPVVIKSISHSKAAASQETITFKFDAPVVPKIFTIPGENPRIVIDLPESIYWGNNFITLTDSLMASAIRTGLHRTPAIRTRAVIDLSKEVPVRYTSEYSKQENTLVVTLTTDTAQPQSGTPLEIQAQNQSTLPIQKEHRVQLQDEKNPATVTPKKEGAGTPADGSITKPEVPTILEISFDDSSSRGEMVLIRLNNFYPPIVSAVEKETPRVLCDFADISLASDVEKNIEAHGKFIKRIRTAMHHDPEKVRVVLDLSPNRDYDLQQVFFKNDNLFVLIVNEMAPVEKKK